MELALAHHDLDPSTTTAPRDAASGTGTVIAGAIKVISQ
jgi:hypothetical protein